MRAPFEPPVKAGRIESHLVERPRVAEIGDPRLPSACGRSPPRRRVWYGGIVATDHVDIPGEPSETLSRLRLHQADHGVGMRSQRSAALPQPAVCARLGPGDARDDEIAGEFAREARSLGSSDQSAPGPGEH